MSYTIKSKDGRRWKVREARSLKDALNEIAHACVRGSIGGKTVLHTSDGEIVLSDVVQINSDGTERKAYSAAY